MLVQELNKRYGLNEHLVFIEEDGLRMAYISNQLANCKVSLYGGRCFRIFPRDRKICYW